MVQQIEGALESIRISEEDFKKIKSHIQKTLKDERSKHQERLYELHKKREEIENQIDRLTNLLLKNNITQDAYNRKHTELQTSQHELTVLLSEHSEHNDTLEQALITVYALSHKASLVIKSSKTASKRVMLKTVFSNFELYAEKLCWAMVSVFSAILNYDDYEKWLC